MIININLDETSEKEINELAKELDVSKSKIIRNAINEFYLKEKRAKDNLLFFVDLYNKGVVDRNILFLLLPRKDAEAIIIGSKFGKGAAEIAEDFDS